MKLQLGSGLNVIPGWVNTDVDKGCDDIIVLDFTKPFPYDDDCVEAVFCEHTIEHVAKEEARFMCSEVFRVLRPGCPFRVVTPSLERMARLVFYPEGPVTTRYVDWFRTYSENPRANVCDAFNAMFYWHGHRHLFTRDDLMELLGSVGFVEPLVLESGMYGDEIFLGVDSHGKWIGEDISRIESMAFEVRKPKGSDCL